MLNENVAEELLAETSQPQDAYENAIRREKDIEHSRTMKPNPFGFITSSAIKQEPISYIQHRSLGENQNRNTQISMSQKQCYACGKN